MLRMFKVTSPMSVGSWILSVSGAPPTSLAGFNALSGRLARLAVSARARGRRVRAARSSTYTAALFADTAVPAWHEARRELPFVFAAGAALSAGGAVSAATPVRSAAAGAPARPRGGGGRAGRHRDHGTPPGPARRDLRVRVGRARSNGRAGPAWPQALPCWPRRGARSRPAAIAGGVLACAGALATRWSVFEAGRASAADPRYVVEPQRERIAARAARASGPRGPGRARRSRPGPDSVYGS